ncbi:MAG TPA: hypothetical protein VHP57_03780, partial [Acidimicrobiia bacterium]|nr:hypothetical protein [Acidimicrobiia bacterium]
MPGRILASIPDHRLVLLSAQDGSVTRVVAKDIGPADLPRPIEVAANSETAFFSYRASKAHSSSCSEHSLVASVVESI